MHSVLNATGSAPGSLPEGASSSHDADANAPTTGESLPFLTEELNEDGLPFWEHAPSQGKEVVSVDSSPLDNSAHELLLQEVTGFLDAPQGTGHREERADNHLV